MNDLMMFAENQWMLILLWAVLTLMLIQQMYQKFLSGVKYISNDDLIAKINQNNVKMYDIRSKEEYLQGHIKHSKHQSLDEISNETSLKKLKNESKEVVIICNTGTTASKLIGKLQKESIQAVVLEKGIQGWKEEKLPLAKS